MKERAVADCSQYFEAEYLGFCGPERVEGSEYLGYIGYG